MNLSDSYRIQLVTDQGNIRVFTRRGHDWTAKYALLARAAAELDLDRATIDGEIIVADNEGKPRFGELKSAIASRPEDLIFMAFDLLHLGDHDLRRMAVEERRHILRDLIPDTGRIQFQRGTRGRPKDAVREHRARRPGGNGVEELGSRYRSGPSREWLKAKCYSEGTSDVAGAQRR